MAKKTDVLALHAKHPDWYAAQIAEALGCDSAYVRATAQRNGLKLRKGGNGRQSLGAAEAKRAYDLGMACVALGLTLADILDFSERPQRRSRRRHAHSKFQIGHGSSDFERAPRRSHEDIGHA